MLKNGQSPPLHIGMERLVVTPKRGPHVPPSMGGTWGYTWSEVTNPREVVGWLEVTKIEEWLASAYVLMCVHPCVRSVP